MEVGFRHETAVGAQAGAQDSWRAKGAIPAASEEDLNQAQDAMTKVGGADGARKDGAGEGQDRRTE